MSSTLRAAAQSIRSGISRPNLHAVVMPSGVATFTWRREESTTPELPRAVLQAEFLLLIDLRYGVGRRVNFDHQVRRAEDIIVGIFWLPALSAKIGHTRHSQSYSGIFGKSAERSFELCR
jgi:hypothetical protein